MRPPQAAAATDRAAIAEGSRQVCEALMRRQAQLKATAARLHAARAVDVHDARVAARRLRSLLATYRPLLETRRTRALRRRLRSFARALSGVREADVRRDMLLALVKRKPGLAAAEAGRLGARLREARVEAGRSLQRKAATDQWAASVQMLVDERTLQALVVRGDAGLAEVLELADRPWHKADGLLARPVRSAEQLHRLRLAFKRCRYALESVSSLEPARAERALDRLRSAQDSLGEHRDAAQAREWVRENQERLGRPLARQLDRLLRRHERVVKMEAVERAAAVLPAYARWRSATLELTRSGEETPDRA